MQNTTSHSGLPVEEVRTLYNSLTEVYPSSDRWHSLTKRWIAGFVSHELLNVSQSPFNRILNLGSGGESYGIDESSMLHVDVQDKWVRQEQQFLKADIHALPLPDSSFDSCICVGSVLNHCDAARVIAEIARVLRPGGKLILEFEPSASWDLIFTPGFNSSASIVPTFYQGKEIRLWAYAERYIQGLLSSQHISIVRRESMHCVSGIGYLLVRNSNLAAYLHILDRWVSKIPILERGASNVIFSCSKQL